jgi:hypothetical protein
VDNEEEITNLSLASLKKIKSDKDARGRKRSRDDSRKTEREKRQEDRYRRKQADRDIPKFIFINKDGEFQNLYQKEQLPTPENTIETLIFNAQSSVALSYTPYFKVPDDRQFDYLENSFMAGTLAAFIARLEIARIKAQLVEIAIPDAYFTNPDPFLKCSIGGASYIIDGEQIELQDGKLSLIFTGLPA